MSIDRSKIKVGDQVKVEYLGLTGWQTVSDLHEVTGRLELEPAGLRVGSFGDEGTILEHKPAPVKIEVELPEPKPFGRWSLVAQHTNDNLPHIKIGRQDNTMVLVASEAEQYALAILALVHEARR